MSKKTFNLITGIIGAVQAAAVAIVTYTEPTYATAINSAIVIAGTAAIEICNLFIKEEK
jgi:ethanolamine utilization microcompartment shell protein EutL